MIRSGRSDAWIVVAGLVALLAGACGPEGASTPPRDAAPTPAADPDPLPPVQLPDLSRLAATAQDAVRARYATLERARADDATVDTRATAYGDLALILMAAEYFDDAAASLRHAEALVPRDARWPYYLGHLHRRTETRDAAVAAFERALELAPSDVPTLVWLGRARLDQGRPEAAEPLFTHAAALDPQSAAALAGAGQAALARRSFLRATEYLEQALAIEPRASSLRYPLAMAYRALGQLEAAAAHLARRGDAEPPLPDPRMEAVEALLPTAMTFERRGIDALGQGQWAAAVDAFRTGLALDPDNPSLRQRLATALAVGGDTGAARAELEETLRRAPTYARAHFSLGAILALDGRLADAADHYRTALEHQPGYVEARMGLAEALKADGQLEAALPHYAQVVEVDPGLAEAWVGRAEALLRLARYGEARDWLATARAVHPDRPELADLEATLPR